MWTSAGFTGKITYQAGATATARREQPPGRRKSSLSDVWSEAPWSRPAQAPATSGSARATSPWYTSRDAPPPPATATRQSLVEFALILPIFLLLIMGIVDAGRLIYTFNTVSNAARKGARIAIVNQSTAGRHVRHTPRRHGRRAAPSQSGMVLSIKPADVDIKYRD